MALGILANIFFIIGGFFRSPTQSMMFVILGNLTYIGYYYLMGLNAPIISVAVGTIACLVAVTSPRNDVVKYSSIFVAIIVSGLVLAKMQGLTDIFIVLAAWAIACAQMKRDNYISYKTFVMVSQSLWIVYCAVNADYAMLMTCAFIIGTNTISLYRNLAKDGVLEMLFAKRAYVRVLAPKMSQKMPLK